MNVLVIAPHPDDESIGCGGTIRKHFLNGDRVVVVFLTSGELGLKHLPRDKAWATREAEAGRAAAILGVADTHFLRGPDWNLEESAKEMGGKLRPVVSGERPSMIYVPHTREWHPDHKAALPVLEVAIQGSGVSPVALRAYEVWTPLSDYDHVEDISSVMPLKLRAIRAHKSQVEQLAYDEATKGLNAFRGVMAGRCRYAEVFQTITLKLP